MQSLIPIPSDQINQFTVMLIDPNRLLHQYGFNGGFRVLKTEIFTSCKEWEVQIVTGHSARAIFSSDQIGKNNKCSSPFNLAKLLGHGISIMPWQKLQVRFNNGYGSAISYIEDN